MVTDAHADWRSNKVRVKRPSALLWLSPLHHIAGSELATAHSCVTGTQLLQTAAVLPLHNAAVHRELAEQEKTGRSAAVQPVCVISKELCRLKWSQLPQSAPSGFMWGKKNVKEWKIIPTAVKVNAPAKIHFTCFDCCAASAPKGETCKSAQRLQNTQW